MSNYKKFIGLMAFIIIFIAACGGGGGGGKKPSVRQGTVLKQGVFDLPPLTVSPAFPSSGEAIELNFSIADATSIVVDVSGEGCGSLSGGAGTDSISQSGFAGQKGQCLLTAVVTTGQGQSTMTASFSVVPDTLTLPGVSVNQAEYIPSGELPQGDAGPGSPVLSGLTTGELINGGTGTFRVQADNPSNIVQALIRIVGVDGYFASPVRIEDGMVVFDVSVDQSFFSGNPDRTGSDTLGNTLSFDVVLQDINGRYSNMLSADVNVTQVGVGTLQVSLSWDTPTDVDLHVKEPEGETIYFLNKFSINGGTLDLDSNAGCEFDNVNNENIVWDETANPPNGEYIVYVDYFSACGTTAATSYTVTVNNCGKTQTFTGTLTDELAGPQEVARVSFAACAGYYVSGRATYEDFAQTSSGLSTVSTMLPIRFAEFDVRRLSDNAVLATGFTDADGRFSMRFNNDGDSMYYIVVNAAQENEIVKQKVVDNTGRIYVKKSQDIDGSTEPVKNGVVIEAKKQGAAPAFNIFDMGIQAAMLVHKRHGYSPPALLTWQWTAGQQGECNSASCYIAEQQKISVLSIKSDPDEYDDMVLLHEYGHFYQDKFSKDDSKGGSHKGEERVDPLLAWSEGSATLFGNMAKPSSVYLDTGFEGIMVRYDLETPPDSIPLGTHDNTMSGNVSEILVAGILWDLQDASNEIKATGEADTVTNPMAVLSAMGDLRDGRFSDRGVTGTDLVDYLDVWFCYGNDNRGNAVSGVEGIVNGIFQFPYDYSPPCQ